MKLLIAGNPQEAQYWLSKNYPLEEEHRYVHNEEQLRGIENPHGIFIGSWIYRKDIDVIIQALITSTRIQNPQLMKAYSMWWEKYRI